MTEVCAVLSDELGTRIAYVDQTVDEAYASRRGYSSEQWQLDAWVSTYTAIAADELSTVTDHVELVTGTPAMSLRDTIRLAR